MYNAKQEFLDHVGDRAVLAATVDHINYSTSAVTMKLPPGYTHIEYESFLKSLDFEYDDGYGTQALFGLIWYKDGTWSERYSYDGEECWQHCSVPDLNAYF